MSEDWKASDFAKRTYVIEDDEFGKKPITLVLRIGSRVIAELALVEPGLVSVVSRASDPGLRLDVVRPDGMRVLDLKTPGEADVQRLEPWQVLALGLEDPRG